MNKRTREEFRADAMDKAIRAGVSRNALAVLWHMTTAGVGFQYLGGHAALAEFVCPDAGDPDQIVARAIRELVAAGLVTRETHASPGQNAVYEW